MRRWKRKKSGTCWVPRCPNISSITYMEIELCDKHWVRACRRKESLDNLREHFGIKPIPVVRQPKMSDIIRAKTQAKTIKEGISYLEWKRIRQVRLKRKADYKAVKKYRKKKKLAAMRASTKYGRRH